MRIMKGIMKGDNDGYLIKIKIFFIKFDFFKLRKMD